MSHVLDSWLSAYWRHMLLLLEWLTDGRQAWGQAPCDVRWLHKPKQAVFVVQRMDD